VRRLASKETVAWIERETTTGYVSPINPTGKPCKSCGALGGNHFRGCKQ
jgi:hypothetical protein